MSLLAIHHVQLAMPKGQEDRARAFYVGLLGLAETQKPPVLARRGGAWFGAGPLRLHLGVEDDFRPALKAHPALETDDLDALAAQLSDAGAPVIHDSDLLGYRRFYTADPFGNRIEILQSLE